MRIVKCPRYRQLNYYSSSSWNNKPLTDEEMRAMNLFWKIPFVIFCFFIVLFIISFVIIPSIEDGVFIHMVVILSIVFWARHKIVNRERFK